MRRTLAGHSACRGHTSLVDIDLGTFNIDASAARQALTPKAKAIIVPHLFGLSADLTELEALGVPIIEDCAQTLGATEQGRRAGSIGILTVCSFYATKLLCAGEGGMVLSRDESLLERVRRLREYDKTPSLYPGSTNLKMTDLHAAIGLAQLERLDSFLERRRWLAEEYRAALSGVGLVCQPCQPGTRTPTIDLSYASQILRPQRTDFTISSGALRREGSSAESRYFARSIAILGWTGSLLPRKQNGRHFPFHCSRH
ncbi:MAG: hypothetical protein HC938_00035 [Nitrospira sp.]|nr:hypothetical protein [Nitrospira sp.]